MYTRKCKDPTCGFENGIRIVGPGLPPLKEEVDGEPEECIVCGFGIEWELIGMSGPDSNED